MSSLTQLLSKDLEVGIMLLKCDQALHAMHEHRSDRKHELHVSDFTRNDKNFCAPSLVVRYLKGDPKQYGATWIQYDGKFREEKWKRVFEQAGILVDYQLELRRGALVGHPDFVVDYGQGLRIVELTGHDQTLNPILLALRGAVKKRQLSMYLSMMPADRGFVLVENKGTCEFKFLPLERDAPEHAHLWGRVELVNGFIHSLALVEPGARADVFKQFMVDHHCQKKHCGVCPK